VRTAVIPRQWRKARTVAAYVRADPLSVRPGSTAFGADTWWTSSYTTRLDSPDPEEHGPTMIDDVAARLAGEHEVTAWIAEGLE